MIVVFSTLIICVGHILAKQIAEAWYSKDAIIPYTELAHYGVFTAVSKKEIDDLFENDRGDEYSILIGEWQR